MTILQSHYQIPFLQNNNTNPPFAVRRIICIGRNYAEHAKEMGHNPNEAPPFFFYKPLTALFPVVSDATNWSMPQYSHNVHHELELAIAIGSKPTASNPEASIIGAGIALDMTCRDTQQEAKKQGRPWDTSKGFDHSAPISPLFPCTQETLQTLGDFYLTKNGVEVQRGNIKDMLWSIPELLKQIALYTELGYGDLILTGTPAGVGPVTAGVKLKAEIPSQNCVVELMVV